jgi:hypothetical protein
MHDEPCRFFSNSDRIDTVRFYEALPNAPTLGIWSVVYCSENDAVKWPPQGVGTIRRTPFGFTGATSPAGLLFDHICGTEDEFANGAIYDPARPPAPIGAQGLPLCCFPPPRIGGGGGAGGVADYRVLRGYRLRGGSATSGRAYYSAVTYLDALAGGLEVGGRMGDVQRVVDPLAGGLEIGGPMGDATLTTDPLAGGVELGGGASDAILTTDPLAGGVELGGDVGDVPQFVDPLAGGLEIGGAVGDVQQLADALAGGLEIGGSSVGDVQITKDPLAGGLEIGGAVGDVYTPPPPFVRDLTIGTISGGWSFPTVVVGDLLVCFIAGEVDPPSVNPPWTLNAHPTESTSGATAAMLTRVYTGTGTLIPIGGTIGSYNYFSIGNASVVDALLTGTQTAPTTRMRCDIITTTTSQDLGFCVWCTTATPSSITYPTGFLITGEGSSFTKLHVGRKTYPLGSNGPFDATCNVAVRWVSIHLAVK